MNQKTTKLLLNTLRVADGGKVVCDVSTPDGSKATSVIEQSFFAEFNPTAANSPQRQLRIVQDNVDYLETEAQRQWAMGQTDIVIR